MTRSASGTYSLPSACMKSYWVSTSQKMTRAMAGNLSEDTGACQREGGRAKALPALKFEDYCDLVTAVVARAPHAVGPHLEREVLALGGREPELHKKLGFAGQREDLGQAVRPRLGNQRREQGAPDARPLPILPHRECGELRQVAGVHLERPATDDVAPRRFHDDVLLDMAAEIVVRTWQQVAALDVRRHQGFELRHVGEHRTPQRYAGERGAGSGTLRGEAQLRPGSTGTAPRSALPVNRQRAHARISSRIATPRSSSSTAITSGGSRRITCGPAVTTSSPRSRAAATNGAAGSVSSSPHMSPRPRAARPATRPCGERRRGTRGRRSCAAPRAPQRRRAARRRTWWRGRTARAPP